LLLFHAHAPINNINNRAKNSDDNPAAIEKEPPKTPDELNPNTSHKNKDTDIDTSTAYRTTRTQENRFRKDID
jgi:hypothetical protein